MMTPVWSGSLACAQLQILPDPQPQVVFGGSSQRIETHWHNASGAVASAEIRTRLSQASAATVAPVSEVDWKKLEVLPGQTVLESATQDFPAVKAETKFLVQWLGGSNRVFGATTVWVYPTNLLAELKPLMGEAALGVLDPTEQLKPLLKQDGVEFVDLGATALEDFRGKLAILGPFTSKDQIHEGLPRAIKQIAGKGVAVVWLQPPPGPRDALQPSFYPVPVGTNSVVVAQDALVANLAKSPQSQSNLLRLCRLALNPEPARLPEFTDQP